VIKKTTFPLETLNPQQLEVVTANPGPVLVLAGAGSGKTRVLTYRIAYLIHELGVSPREILAMTFTNKAASEMKERIAKITPIDKNLWIGTFHSIFARILRVEAENLGYQPDFVIYDSDDQERLVKSILQDLNFAPSQYAPKSVLSAISRAKSSLILPEAFMRSTKSPFEEVIAQIYPEYQNRLKTHNAFDFDDLLISPIFLFEKFPDLLEKYQSRMKYILVDEYQDTNRAQYQLIYLLAKSHKNLFVVGDDDQSIYRWRGADLRNILEFEKDFADTQIFRLEQNYRSTQNILIAANSVVRKNLGRKEKTLWSKKEHGEKVDIFEVRDEREEGATVVEKIQEEVFRKKRHFSDFVVLYRTNAQSRILEDSLRRNGISYVIVGGVRFYERKEIKDILAYLKLIMNPRDEVSLNRIINFPARGIGDVSLQRLQNWARSQNLDLFHAVQKAEEIEEIPTRTRQSIKRFYQIIQTYIGLKDKISLNELVRTLIDETGLLAMYKTDTSVEGETRKENVQEFLNAINDYVRTDKETSLRGFLEEVALIADIDNWDQKANAVTLMTLHCAKGLEFPVVMITGLEDSLLPISRSLDNSEDLEEERRLFYVGLTRAKEKVYLFYALQRSFMNDMAFRLPSRFLDDLDPSVVNWTKAVIREYGKPFQRRRQFVAEASFEPHPDYENISQETSPLKIGIMIEHEIYGRGKVIRIEGKGQKQKVGIRFDSGVEKKFMTQYARFTII
jgi:DNA helicase-2/ATP-dependent DNA helicase PcrA